MRTTLDVDDDVLAAARSLARVQRRSIGSVLSALARRGLNDRIEIEADDPVFPVFDVPGDRRPITSEMVRAAQDDLSP